MEGEEEAVKVQIIIKKIKILQSDVPESTSDRAEVITSEALAETQIEKDIATYIKKKFDEEFKGTWHCCVGRNFGCSITHETKHILFYKVEQFNVLLFQSFN